MHLNDFIHQKPYERIQKVVRRSSITFIPYIVMTVLLLAIPWILYTLGNDLFPEFFNDPMWYSLLTLGASGYSIAIVLFLYGHFVAFYLDMLVITNDRLLEIEQRNLFSRAVSETDLYTIQDVSSEVHGFFASLFNYGDLTIQTAAAMQKFIIHNVPDPNGLRHLILTLAEEDRKFHNPYMPSQHTTTAPGIIH